MKKKSLFLFALGLLSCRLASAGETGASQTDIDAGIYQQSVKTTKQSIDREMLGVLYHDAVDAYQDRHFDEALELLDKIYSLDPHYEDVSKLRDAIRKSRMEKEWEATLGSVRALMRQGEQAYQAGKNVVAINFWKQALDLNPEYAPAKKRIQDVNQVMAQKQFETGYIHYRHGELEDALDAWSNAIALDPTYKQRGLLLLMSKVELQVERSQISRLAAQGFDQYQQGNLEAALQSYDELSKLEPRNEEARRSSAKIKIQLSQTALKAAQDALAARAYPEAITQADKCVAYGYEIESAQKVKMEANRLMQLASQPKPKRVLKKPVVAVSTGTAVAAAPPEPAKPRNPEEALIHYRKGLSAIRAKDYHLASEEFDIAAELDPTDERIYMARERAHQAWTANNAESGGAAPEGAASPSAAP